MDSYTELMFRERTRVSHATFQYLCEELGPFLRKQDTNYRINRNYHSREKSSNVVDKAWK